ncbi:MAG TPA: AbrB/MazE/SpoVT family DNA-binding domain-containing protein [Chloroflexota bacterium]|nr:AbrB/MazE/SpoVT family DNA-binding domain-containing protein [Chloroflexota bacterium]
MAAEMVTVVTRKGQVTIPAAIRRSLGIKEGDTVTVAVEGDAVKLRPTRTSIRDFYQSVPALTPARTWAEITEIAAEEHAGRAATEGLDRP